MRLHILVEGPAEEAFVNEWMPRFLPSQHLFKTIVHRGKGRLSEGPTTVPDPKRQGLLDQLPAKLKAYAKCLNSSTDRVLVLIDSDDEPCRTLKQRLVRCHRKHAPEVVARFRIAIEETEAFYLGEPKAIKRAFPKAKLHKLSGYVQDSVCGTWELFRDIIGYRTDMKDKPSWATEMGKHITVDYEGRFNKSPSFRQLCRGILQLCGELPKKTSSKNPTGENRGRAK